MKIDAHKLAKHLSRIYLPRHRGEILDVVLRARLEATALSADGSLLATVPPLPGAEELSEEVGVNLGRLIGHLKAIGRHRESRMITMDFGDNIIRSDPGLTDRLRTWDMCVEGRLIIAVPDGQLGSFVPMDLRGAPNYIAPEKAAELMNMVTEPEGSSFATDVTIAGLDEDADEALDIPVDDVQSAVLRQIPKDHCVRLECDGKGGRLVGPMNPDGSSAENKLMWSFKHKLPLRVEEPIKLTFSARPMVSVLSKLRAAAKTVRISVRHPSGPLLFTTDDGYRYLLASLESRRTVPR